uniref:small monomeric GTPase n=1 Tax=Phallusia mammillata TaxID=59560 RepID=A0A6F9DMC3_9ASCI|nr:ras-like protein 2 [Phallusia mammillata]
MRRYSVNNSTAPPVRLVVLGDQNVGKSALVVRFLTKRFIGEYATGTEITYQHDLTLAGTPVTAEICDATYCKNHQTSLKKYVGKCDAYLIVYSVCSRDSFEYACSLAHDIRLSHVKSSNQNGLPPILLVGNKCDLDHYREVKRSEGERIANTLSSCYFVETSAAESFQRAEEAFHLAFRLISLRYQTLLNSSTPTPKRNRKKSFSQVAHMIRDHYKKQTSPGSEKSSEGFSPIFRSWSMSSDRNNNGNPFQEGGKRSRRSAVSALKTNQSLHGFQRPQSKCMSLETLNEKPDAENDPASTMPRCSSPARKTSLYQHNKYHTIDSAMATRFCNPNDDSARSRASSDGNKMSVSTDENFDLSDFSTAEDDPFSSNFESSLSSNPSLCESRSRVEEAEMNFQSSSAADDNKNPQRKTSLNKKCLKISIHSDGEAIEDGGISPDAANIPPKSAPLLASSNKFRFFPNGIPENQENGWVRFGSTRAPVSPLLDGRRRNKNKLKAEESKKSPPGNLLMQFFKGNLASTSNSRQTPGPTPAISETSIASTCTIGESIRSSNASLADSDDGRISFHTSNSSLSPSMGNGHWSNDPSWSSTSSAPTSPSLKKSSVIREKTRRPSFRATVHDFIRKRKKSHPPECYRIQDRVY